MFPMRFTWRRPLGVGRTRQQTTNITDLYRGQVCNRYLIKQQTVVIRPCWSLRSDGVRPDSTFHSKDAYPPRALFVPNPPLNRNNNDSTNPATTLHDDTTPVSQMWFTPDGGVGPRKIYKISLDSSQPIAALMFQAKPSETFVLILTAGIAAPTIDVIVPSQRKSLREVLEPHLGDLTENHLMALTGCRPGSDYFSGIPAVRPPSLRDAQKESRSR